jgi:DNA-binding SARP family transcriptional activator
MRGGVPAAAMHSPEREPIPTPTTPRAVELRLFGAPQLLVDGAPSKLARKSIALLAYVAMAGRVTRAKLAGVFWGELDNNSARRNLRRELHRLREAGAADVLAAGTDVIEPAAGVDTDTAQFERLLAQAEFDTALRLYRGPLLDGLDLDDAPAFSGWLSRERERLAGMWRKAMLTQVNAQQAAGREREALDGLLALIDEDPLQESLYAAAMRVLDRTGERTRALELYERLRATLRRELDLDPLPATAALAEQIRAAEQLAPLLVRANPPGLLRFEAPLVGRAPELNALRLACTPMVLIEGEAGVGKSRLATEHALDSAPLVRMQGTELARGAALFAVAETLRQAIADPALRRRLYSMESEIRAEVARLVPDLPDAPQPATATGTGAQLRFLSALAAALAALIGGGILVVDDLHWLDDSSLAVIERLVRGPAAGEAARVVATARSAELADAPGATESVRKLERAKLLTRIPLCPLTQDGTVELVRALSGTHAGELFAQRLQRTAHGNPFFMLETIRFLFDIGELAIDERGQWITTHENVTADYGELPVPPTVQQAVAERVERLGPAARRVLEAAALAGDPFTLADVQPATALADIDALDGLERALQAQVLLHDDTGYHYVHDVTRSAVDASLRVERRQLIHLRLAEAFENRQGRADRIAAHFHAAGRNDRALPWHVAAARAAEKIFAWREALAHLAAAVQATEDRAMKSEYHRARCELLRYLFAHAELHHEADAMAALAAGAGDDVLGVEASLWHARALDMAENASAAAELAQSTLQRASVLAVPPTLAFDLSIAVARGLHGTGRLKEAEAHVQNALARLNEVDVRRQMEARFEQSFLLVSLNAPDRARVPLEQARSLADDCGNIEMYCKAGSLLGYVLHVQGDTSGAVQVMTQAQRRADEASLYAEQRSLLTNLVKLHVQQHDAPAAMACMQQALHLFRDDEDSATQSRLCSRMTEVSLLAGDLTAALDSSAQSIALLQSLNSAAGTFWPWYQRARLLWQLGDSEAAVRTLLDLRETPAWSPLAEVPIDFFSLALRLPHDPAAVFDRLRNYALPVGQAYVDQTDLAYWQAMAAVLAGNPSHALNVLKGAGRSSFNLHPANLFALQLLVAQTCAEPIEALLEQAGEIKAPPLDALELLAARIVVMSGRGDPVEKSLRDSLTRQAGELLAALPSDRREKFSKRCEALLHRPPPPSS